MGKLKSIESRPEKEPALDLNIASLNLCETVDQMIERIESARKESGVDVVVLGEYNFKVEDVLNQLEKIKEAARGNRADIVMAPDNEFGRNLSWGELKSELQANGIAVEESPVPDEYKPQSVGVFIDKAGAAYAFPKTWHLGNVRRPVHKIPGTSIGITICGEIGEIQPQDLEGLTVLYNPSREGDDPYLKFRMLHRHGSGELTREAVAALLKNDTYYQSLLDDSQYNPDDPDYIPEYDSRNVREQKFNDAVDSHLEAAANPENSMYVKKIEGALLERNIPVVRTDGAGTTGVLNKLPNAEIENLEYREGLTRYNLKIKV